LAVAFFDRVMLLPATAVIVVPAAMPGPLTAAPTANPVVLATATVADWFVSVPVKPTLPRWSVVTPAGIAKLLPAWMAGLPGSKASVWVGPPLLARPAAKFGLPVVMAVPVRALDPVAFRLTRSFLQLARLAPLA